MALISTSFANPDILVPQRRIGRGEVRHHGYAALVVQQRNPHTVLGQPVMTAGKRARLTDDHRADVELPDEVRCSTSRGDSVVTMIVER